MPRFSDKERALILEQSRRILTNEQPARPEPEPEREVRIEFESDMDRWRREADESDRQREACRAELRREHREDVRQRQAPDLLVELAARISTLETRVDAIAEALAGLDTLANSTMAFSDATVARLQELQACAHKAGLALETMRAVHQREVDTLRDRLASSEALHTRETVLLAKELADTRRELDARADLREHVRTRLEVAGVNERLENVVSLVREDLAERRR
jgi:hypothetical protein